MGLATLKRILRCFGFECKLELVLHSERFVNHKALGIVCCAAANLWHVQRPIHQSAATAVESGDKPRFPGYAAPQVDPATHTN